MNRKQRYALFVAIAVTLVYWGFYNWIAWGINVEPPVKAFASLFFLFFAIPAIGITHDNTDDHA